MTNTTKILSKLRFPEFENDGEWKVVKFKDIFTILSSNTLSRAELSENDGHALNVHYGDVLIKFGERLDLNNDNLPHIKDDEILHKYKSSYLKDGDVIFADTAEDETAGKCTEIRNIGKRIVISGLHTIPCRPNNEFAPYYMGYYLNSNAYHTKLLPLMQGAKVTSISRSSIQETTVVYPLSLPEQQKIAAFLTSLDELISAHTKKLEALKAHKKGLMQQLFPANGEKTPKLRFPEFKNNGEWKEVRLGDVTKERNEINKTELALLSIGQDGVYPQSESTKRDVSNKDKTKYKHICPNDIGYNTMRMWQGRSAISYLEGIVSPAYTIVIPQANIVPLFLAIVLKLPETVDEFFKHSQGLVSDTLNCKYKDFVQVQICIPSLPEQQKIASFLTSIDEMIQAQDDKIRKLKTYKNGLIQQMFAVETPYYDVSTVID